MTSDRPSLVVLIQILLLSLALAMGACKKKQDAVREQDRVKPVVTDVVKRGDIAEVLEYPAELLPYAEVRVFSAVPDRIIDFPWRDGQEIQKGQRVALVRKEGLDRGLEQLAAQLEGLDAQIRNLDAELARSRSLADAGVLTQNVVDNVETQYLAMQAQRKALTASRAQLAVTAGNAIVTAPIDGVIAGKTLEKGDMASPQVPLCRIMQIDRLKVTLRLVEADVPKVRVGQAVSIELDAHPGKRFQGVVTTVLPYLDRATRTNAVEVTLENPVDPASGQRALKPGMFGRARLVVEERKGVLLAAETAMMLDDALLAAQKPGETLRRVAVAGADGVAHLRVVRLGARNGALWEVTEGVSEGEQVVVRGQHGLRDGQPVQVVAADSDKK
jgi:membrane fusion protein (multidrug efflux system)